MDPSLTCYYRCKMSVSILKPPRCVLLPPVPAQANGTTHSKVTTTLLMVNNINTQQQSLPSLQVREKEKPQLQETRTITSRREMMHLTAASLCFVSLLLPSSAEARPRNATMRQKIMKKFEELRKKAGLENPKDESAEKKPKAEDAAKKPTPKEGTEEKKPKAKDNGEKKPVTPQKDEPRLPNILNGKTVETTLP